MGIGSNLVESLEETSEKLKEVSGRLEKADELVGKDLENEEKAKQVEKEETDLEKFRKDVDKLEKIIERISSGQANLEEVDKDLLVLAEEAVSLCREHKNVPVLLAKLSRQKRNLGNDKEATKLKEQAEMTLIQFDGLLELVEELISGEEKLEYQSEEKRERVEHLESTKDEIEEFRSNFKQKEKERVNEILRS
jgi:exonuclease VII small subunit